MIPGHSLPKLAECRECHDPIRFVRMATTGRNMPVNPLPIMDADTPTIATGSIAARLAGPALVGHVITLEHPAGDREPYRFTPHWSTCAAQKARKPAPPIEADTALF